MAGAGDLYGRAGDISKQGAELQKNPYGAYGTFSQYSGGTGNTGFDAGLWGATSGPQLQAAGSKWSGLQNALDSQNTASAGKAASAHWTAPTWTPPDMPGPLPTNKTNAYGQPGQTPWPTPNPGQNWPGTGAPGTGGGKGGRTYI